MKDQALPIVFLVGLIAGFTLVHPACQTDTVPSPPPAAEGASSSGCDVSTFQCCQTWVEEPTCKDGALTCREGWITCGGVMNDP